MLCATSDSDCFQQILKIFTSLITVKAGLLFFNVYQRSTIRRKPVYGQRKIMIRIYAKYMENIL